VSPARCAVRRCASQFSLSALASSRPDSHNDIRHVQSIGAIMRGRFGLPRRVQCCITRSGGTADPGVMRISQ